VAGHGKPREPEFLPPLALPKAVAQSTLALSLVQCARGSSVMIGSEECHGLGSGSHPMVNVRNFESGKVRATRDLFGAD
jgi:hypothetical protein